MAYIESQIKVFKEIIIGKLSVGYSLKKTLDSNKDLPCRATVYTWLNEEHPDYDKEFLNNYTRAREDSADIDAEKVEEIAEKVLDGTYEPAQAKAALDCYKWTAGVKKPKKYGAKVDLTSGGDKIQQPQTIQVEIVKPD